MDVTYGIIPELARILRAGGIELEVLIVWGFYQQEGIKVTTINLWFNHTMTNTCTVYRTIQKSDLNIGETKNLYDIQKLQIPLFTDYSEENQLKATDYRNTIINGDCEDVLKSIPDNSVDLIFTSPPYADQRTNTYGGIKPDRYVSWFIPKSEEFLRVLNPKGSFVLNIKERVVDGERHTYVIELILELRRQGWIWTEEYMWHKKNSHPGKWPNRFRDNWERLLHFTKQRKFNMYQEEVMVPVGDWAGSRLKNLSETDKKRDNSRVGSGFGKRIENWVGRDMVYPSNVLHMATECYNQQHSAVFPVALPEWFIKLFTKPGDLILDPFNGSGTTSVAAYRLHRDYIGIDVNQEYCELAINRLHTETSRNGKKNE